MYGSKIIGGVGGAPSHLRLLFCKIVYFREVPYCPPKSDVKRQKLIECLLTGNSKQYLGKVYTEEQINKLCAEEVDKLFSNYETKLSGKMVKSLGKPIIRMYSIGACSALSLLLTQRFLTFRCVPCVKIKDTDDVSHVKEGPQLP